MVIHGKVPSKSNCYKIVTIHGHGSLAKTKALKDYENSFFMQCPIRDKLIDDFFEFHVRVFYENMRPDLDNCLKILLDCLQSCKAIKNDRQCVKIVAEKFIDKKDPRVEFELKKTNV